MTMEEGRNVTNHFEAGSNCQVFNGPVSGCVFAMPGSNVTQQVAAKQEPEEEDSELGRRLVPFFNKEEEAMKFPERIKGMKNQEITKLVNVLWEKGVISSDTKPTDLWRVLHDLGYYTAGDRNWNDQVLFMKRR